MCLMPTEDVNDYPAVRTLEPVHWPVAVSHGGHRVASSVRAWRLLERGRLPIVFIPEEDVDTAAVKPSNRIGLGDDLGLITYHDVVVDRTLARNAALRCDRPPPELAEIAGHYIFSVGLLDVCTVAGMKADPSAGVDGAWSTPNLRTVLELA